MPKFTIEDVDKDIEARREKNRRGLPGEGGRPVVIQSLLDRAKNRRKRPVV